MALRVGAREEVRSVERNSLDVVDFLGTKASVDVGGQLERVLGSRSHERFHSDLDALAFRNSGAFDRLENSVLEDCLEGGFHRLTTFRSLGFYRHYFDRVWRTSGSRPLAPPPRHVDHEVRGAHRESGRHRDVPRGLAGRRCIKPGRIIRREAEPW